VKTLISVTSLCFSVLSWEITPLRPHPVTNEPRTLCEHLVGIELLGWKATYLYKKFVEEVQMRLLTRVAGEAVSLTGLADAHARGFEVAHHWNCRVGCA
jgi:hypothetical protein